MCVFDNCNQANLDECWKECASTVELDEAEITACQEDEGVALMQEQKALNEENGVRGSPTVFINGLLYSGGRAPDNYKESICCGFSESPEQCTEALSGDSAGAEGSC
jgi:glutaredoxin